MQTIGLRLNVPAGFGVDGLIAKINGYVGCLVTTRQSKALQKAKLDAVMLIPGTFLDCKISDKWKKAEYLEEITVGESFLGYQYVIDFLRTIF